MSRTAWGASVALCGLLCGTASAAYLDDIEFPDVGELLIRDPETEFARYVNATIREPAG